MILIGRGLFLAEIVYEKNSVSECEVDGNEVKSTTATSENNFKKDSIIKLKQMIRIILCSNQRTEVRVVNPKFKKTG